MNNSLAEVHPELVSEWSEKNLPLIVEQSRLLGGHRMKRQQRLLMQT